MTLPTGENFKPAKGFAVVATANTSPDWLDPALRSRFEVEIELRDPNPGVIVRLNIHRATIERYRRSHLTSRIPKPQVRHRSSGSSAERAHPCHARIRSALPSFPQS
jgi:MoxR-like ATPase